MSFEHDQTHRLPYDLVAGAVPCLRGWLMVSAKTRGTIFAPEEPRVVESFADLIDERPAYSVLAIDAQLGLQESALSGSRTCDREAQSLLGPHGGTLRDAPTRSEVLSSASPRYTGVTELMVRRRQREIVAEIEPYRQRTVFEVHPELSFFELNSEQHLVHPRRTAAGRKERIALLERRLPSLDRILVAEDLKGVARYKLVDVAACLWSARRIFQRVGIRLPADPQWNEEGMRMEIIR